MSELTDLFRRRTVIMSRLEPFGFKYEDGTYRYSELFMNGDFRADITVDDLGDISAKVIDVNEGEEYLPVSQGLQTGSFVGTVREELESILNRIAESCFKKTPFLFDQTNRISSSILQRYGERPDYPFRKLPDCGVFRFTGSGKWYAIVMNIKKNKLTGKKADSGTLIEVMNVKADPSLLDALHSENGIYPSYHMNKKNWISLILDDSISDARIMELIETSREYAVHAGKKRSDNDKPSEWIVPANPAYYDVDAAFSKGNDVIWKQGKGIKKGDTVFMYVAAPISAVRYKCVVTETEIPYKYADNNVRMTHLMKLDVIETYDRGKCPFLKLNELGIRAVRGPRTVTPEFLEYMRKCM